MSQQLPVPPRVRGFNETDLWVQGVTWALNTAGRANVY